ncbi:MAG: glyoxalase [Flavipsychrobacter sp.]|nr:glyoxalase [Flavipsychrobacter sp.]
MFKNNKTFSSFSVNDMEKAKDFYANVLGVDIEDGTMPGIFSLALPANKITIYTKPNHTPATFTVLNFIVDGVDKAVDELAAKGVQFEHYDYDKLKTDEKGIVRGYGPTVAWFKDPAGNILSVMDDK